MSANQPNLVFILTDQQRTDTIGAWGNPHAKTPHLDDFSNGAVNFRAAYCPGATCISSRAAIFTGLYAHNSGVYSFDPWNRHSNWVQTLAAAGYYCASIGKMHFMPTHEAGGFHERIVVENPTTMEHANGGPDDDWGHHLARNGTTRPLDRHCTDPRWLEHLQGVPWDREEHLHSDVFIGDSAAAWVKNRRSHKEQPLFLYVGLTGPHEPWDPLPRHLDPFLQNPPEFPSCHGDAEELASKPRHQDAMRKELSTAGHESRIQLEGASEEQMRWMKSCYHAKVSTVDEQIGKVLAALSEKGILENSIVVIASDHGELLGDHGLAYKGLMYENVVHVPLMIRDYRHPADRRDVEALVSLMDIGPTLLSVSGLEIPTFHEGRDLSPWLAGKVPEHWRQAVFCEDGYQIMMRTASWKLVYLIGAPDGELYDLKSDPCEVKNLWHDPAHAGRRRDMEHSLLHWMSRSCYQCAGYHRSSQSRYAVRLPTLPDPRLGGATMYEPGDLEEI